MGWRRCWRASPSRSLLVTSLPLTSSSVALLCDHDHCRRPVHRSYRDLGGDGVDDGGDW
jgi:hypothetical protein